MGVGWKEGSLNGKAQEAWKVFDIRVPNWVTLTGKLDFKTNSCRVHCRAGVILR